MSSSTSPNPANITVVLFHHVLGLTDGVEDMAAGLAEAGFATLTPDLFEGRLFPTIDEGLSFVGEIGYATLIERGRNAIAELSRPVVFAGISMGTGPAQLFAQSDDRSMGAVLIAGCTDPARFEVPWPESVSGQVHLAENDPWNEPDEVHALTKAVTHLDRFDYSGVGHLFMDSSVSADYDESARSQLMHRFVSFLVDLSAGTDY